jgi:DNA-binding CsgD family transcriptional regulator
MHDATAGGRPAAIVEVAHELLDLLSDMVPSRAAGISVYSPMTHSHQTLTSVDCGERQLTWLDRWLADSRGAHHEERERPAQPIVWDGDVVTLPLYSADDRYTGTLHLFIGPPLPSGRHRNAITDQLLRVQALIGGLIDTMRLPSELTADVPASARGVVVLPDSSVVSLPGRVPGQHLVDGGPLPAAIIAAAQRDELPERFRWRDPAGGWHQIQSRAIESGFVITEDDAAMPHGLTARELEVLTLIARGYSNPQIAALLVVSDKTVAKHVEHVLDKLDCASRAAAAAAAVRGGLIELVAPAEGSPRPSGH